MDTTATHRRNLIAALVIAGVLALAVGAPAWALSRADANVEATNEAPPALAQREPPTPPAPVVVPMLNAGQTVVASEWIPSELGTLRVSRGTNTVEVTDGIMSSPSGQSIVKVGGMAAAFGFDPTYEPMVVGDSGLAAFGDALGEGRDIYNPGGRASTSIVVVDFDGVAPSGGATQYDFDANIVPEVFTADGKGLFVIEHRPALNPTSYKVRLLDLSTGQISDVGIPEDSPTGAINSGRDKKLVPGPDMIGSGGRYVGTSSGEFLLTIYSRQPSHEDGRIHPDHGHGFIHALSLADGWAVCVDLPPGFGQGEPRAAAITVDPDDSRFYVVDATAGAVVAYDIDDLDSDVLISQGLPQPAARADLSLDPNAAISALATNDTLWVAQGNELRALSTDLTTTKATYSTEAAVETLVVDDAGRSFALVAGRLVALPTS